MELANEGVFLSDLLTADKGNLYVGITQDDIDDARTSADFITNLGERQDWLEEVALAQQMLDAKNKVDTLLTTDGSNLKDGITIDDVEDAQDLVTALPSGDLKDELQSKIDTARNLLDAKAKTDGLINPDGSLGAGVNQGKIDEAQDAVNKLPSGQNKDDLQKIIDEAQKLLDASNGGNNPTNGNNANNNGNNTDANDNLTSLPQTGYNNSAALMILLAELLISGGYLITRRKELE